MVLEGDASRDAGQLLGTLYDYRQSADYTGTTPDVDVEALATQVETFIDEMDDLVGPLDQES